MLCFCGKNKNFVDCCALFLNGAHSPETPEELMRSRYSAYASQNGQYLFDTYASCKQREHKIEELHEWASQTVWIQLNIIQATRQKIIEFDNKFPPTVTFQAYYIHDKQCYLMQECSRFIVEHNKWRYLDGIIEKHEAITPPNRNDRCFCQSGKKYKKCCASMLQ
ncbi:YchJ family protein [Thalassotalea ganghwensis]